MSLRIRISLIISILFTILFGVVSTIILILFSNFRKTEFKERLEDKALASIKLLVEVKGIDQQLLKIIDQNTINKLYNEKTLIFDKNYQLIYSSLDDTKITWSTRDLHYLKKYKTFFKKDGNNEVYGVFYDSKNNDYFALISANDEGGKRKLNFLAIVLVISYLVFILLTWISTFYFVKKQFEPLKSMLKKISNINENNLEMRLENQPGSKDEINLISKEFNFMMNRIETAYEKQKEFTAQASHELRTPLARMTLQLENRFRLANEEEKAFLSRILADANQLNDLIRSLLLLAKMENRSEGQTESARVDEAIYNSIETVLRQFPDLKINLNVGDMDGNDNLMEVACNQNLLEIAFSNLLKNAWLYSGDHQLNIDMEIQDGKLIARFINNGISLSREEQATLFDPFMRGKNARNTAGSGLGLRIIQRILAAYHFQVMYSEENGKHVFTLIF